MSEATLGANQGGQGLGEMRERIYAAGGGRKNNSGEKYVAAVTELNREFAASQDRSATVRRSVAAAIRQTEISSSDRELFASTPCATGSGASAGRAFADWIEVSGPQDGP
jgi:hypothetical protein